MDTRLVTDGMQIGMTYALLALSGGGYALLLQTKRGRLIATRRAWVAVIGGVALVLGGMLLVLDAETVLVLAGAFCAAGAPMVIRSIWNELRDEAEARQLRQAQPGQEREQ